MNPNDLTTIALKNSLNMNTGENRALKLEGQHCNGTLLTFFTLECQSGRHNGF